jgi:ketosteroid isomerase-like protein
MSSEHIQSAVAQYFAAIRHMDPDAWVACFAEQATSDEPGAPAPLRGHADLRRFFLGIVGAFQKVGVTEDHVFLSATGPP